VKRPALRSSIAVVLFLAACPGPATSPGGAAPAGSVTTSAASASSKEPDVCEGSPPLPHAFAGLARGARCDQDVYYRMAKVADQLGVKCGQCHAPDPKDPNNEKWKDFPAPTHMKDVANWMGNDLMGSLKPTDGSPFTCASCHTDENGKPVAKILGDPRDPQRAASWMARVLVKKFTDAKGNKLTCATCHVGKMGTPEFQKEIILHSDRLPSH
jgi:hypothetical protein